MTTPEALLKTKGYLTDLIPAEDYDEIEEIMEALEPNTGHWIDNNNGTISCSYCYTWFNKDDRYSYMRYCPYCKMKLTESEGKE